jgi:hypothetical protein
MSATELSYSQLILRAENFLKEINKLAFSHHMNGMNFSDIEAMYHGYSDLFSEITVEFLRRSRENSPANNGLMKFAEFIICEKINYSNLRTLNKIDSARKLKQFQIDGVIYSFNELNRFIVWGSEEQRRSLQNIQKEFCSSTLNNIFISKLAKERDIIKSLGYNGQTDLFELLTGINLNEAASAAKTLIDSTNTEYFYLLDITLKKNIDKSYSECSKNDLYKALYISLNDDFFNEGEQTDYIERFLSQAGLSIKNNPFIRIRIESGYAGRAFCSVLDIPGNIQLVIPESNGFTVLRDLLHEAGHAMHYSNISRDILFEFKWLGDSSVSEGFASLFENLLYNEAWLSFTFGRNNSSKNELISRLKFYKLSGLRHLAFKVLYELDLHSSPDISNMERRFAEIYKTVMGVEIEPYLFLAEIEPFCFSARYFRAQMLAENLREKLETTYGSEWFVNRESFDFLKMLWSTGQKLDAGEISAKYCGKNLADANLIKQFKTI